MKKRRYYSTCSAWKSAVALAIALLVCGPLALARPVDKQETVFAPFQPDEAFLERFRALGEELGAEASAYPDGSTELVLENASFSSASLLLTPFQISSNGDVSVVSTEGQLQGAFTFTVNTNGALGTVTLDGDDGERWVLSLQTTASGEEFVESVMYFDPAIGWSTGTINGVVDAAGSLAVDPN